MYVGMFARTGPSLKLLHRMIRITGDLVSHQRRHLSGLLFGLRHPPWIRAGELVCADRRENRHEESEPRGQWGFRGNVAMG
jgi:hypothetical protein